MKQTISLPSLPPLTFLYSSPPLTIKLMGLEERFKLPQGASDVAVAVNDLRAFLSRYAMYKRGHWYRRAVAGRTYVCIVSKQLKIRP